MIFRTRIPATLAVVALLATTACESATYSDRTADGTVTFSFAGDAASGAFSANGGYDRLRPDVANWAVGSRGAVETGGTALAVYARSDEDSDDRVNELILYVQDPQVGTFTCTEAQNTCPLVGYFIVGTTADGEDADAIYSSVSGTVNIVSVSEDFAQGTFSLSMEELDAANPLTVQLTSGAFNVPLIAANDF